MTLFLVGLIVFLGVHLVPTRPGFRDGLVARFGEKGYQGLFSVVSLAAFVLMIYGYSQAPFVEVWWPPLWTRHITELLMLPAFILIVAAYVPSRIRTAAKHPMLASIKLWAVAHLASNGDLASMLLFGGFLAYAVYDRISVKRRGALGPLGTAQGSIRGDLTVIFVGLAAYVVFALWLHTILIGVPAIQA